MNNHSPPIHQIDQQIIGQVHLDFLVAVLHPEDVGKLGSGTSESIAERVVVAQRIVQAISPIEREVFFPFLAQNHFIATLKTSKATISSRVEIAETSKPE